MQGRYILYNKDEYMRCRLPEVEECPDFRCSKKNDRQTSPIVSSTPESSEPPQSAFAALAEMLMIIKTQQDEILNRLQAQHV